MRAFTGEPDPGAIASVRGNPCVIHAGGAAPPSPATPSAVTQCTTWAQRTLRAAVRCWSPTGTEIRLCGHGLLCCARHWQDQWNKPGMLEMGGVEVQCEFRDSITWLGFPTLDTRPCDVPSWAVKLLGLAPTSAARAGPADGYLVLEMPAECDLKSLSAPGAALQALSRRSLIVTRPVRARDSLRGEGIQYRYFAPQYGVPEDAATGSAMRVLAAFWQARGHGPELTALQCSAEGGWLLSRMEKDATWVGGRVTPDNGGENL